jgi:DNA-directed RNA polymerase beta' subunit
LRCATCGLGLKDCAGHFGVVKLPLPVFHPVWVFSVCAGCSLFQECTAWV